MIQQLLRKGRAGLALYGIIAMIFLLAKPSLQVYALETTSVGVFTPATVAVGAQVAVDVEVHNVSNLWGFEMILHFDPLLLSVDDAEAFNPGVQVQMGSFLSAGMVFINTVDLSAGTAQVVVVLFSPSEPVSGSGTLFTVLFGGIADGLSPLTFSGLTLTDRDGVQIPAEVVSSHVTVGAGISYKLYLPLIVQSDPGLMASPGVDDTYQPGDNALFDRKTPSAVKIARAELIKNSKQDGL